MIRMPRIFYRVVLLFSLLLAACGPREPALPNLLTLAPRVTPDATAVTFPSGTLLFQDTFGGPSGWQVFDEADASAAYLDGEYQLRVKRTPFRVSGVLYAWETPSDVTLSIVGRLVSGQDASSGYGLLCRFRDVEHYYFFLVTGDSRYLIGKVSGAMEYSLSGSAFQPSEAILAGQVPNLITAQCIGNHLTLSVNAQPVAQATDDEFQGGQVGVLAAGVEGAGMEARFDDFAIYAP